MGVFFCAFAAPSLLADTHMDAASEEFCAAFQEEALRPDWIVTSPPYHNALEIVKVAIRVSKIGVAFKLRSTFLEPTLTRATWLKNNPPYMVVVLARAHYRGRPCRSTEAWFIWLRRLPQGSQPRQAFFFSD